MNRPYVATLVLALMPGCKKSEPAAVSGASGSGPRVSLHVSNTSSSQICYLYISPVSDPNWGQDQLGSATLDPNATKEYTMPAGQWDLKAEDCQHHQLFVMQNQTIAENATLTLHD